MKLTRKLNANSKKEQERLRKLFPKDKDIVVCKNPNNSSACYVKSRLQPTFAFGDLHLKLEEFNNPQSYDIKA